MRLSVFVLVLFALWNRTCCLGGGVVGNVVSSGIKVMVLAVIVGIGSNYFADFTGAITGDEVSIEQAVSLMLASLALFGLAIFGPGIASGLVAGAPQLGAGSAVRTAEHTSELQSLMRISYAGSRLRKKPSI